MKINQQIKSLGKQAGYTLIELAITISIISVLVVSALFGVQKIIDNNNVNAASQQVSLANTNIAKFIIRLDIILREMLFKIDYRFPIPIYMFPINFFNQFVNFSN